MKLLQLNLHSRKVCFHVNTSKCCGELITELKRFCVYVKKDSIKEVKPLIAYDMFDLNDEGMMCIILDDSFKDLCPGRYVFEVWLDECVLISTVKFQWGRQPVVVNVDVESSSTSDCYDETGLNHTPEAMIPETCCEEECVEEVDPCNKCGCDPCNGCNPFKDPEELLRRDC